MHCILHTYTELEYNKKTVYIYKASVMALRDKVRSINIGFDNGLRDDSYI